MSRKVITEKIHKIEIEGNTYLIKVHFKKIKKLYLRINPQGEITASIPSSYSSAQVNKFLNLHKDWIKNNSKKVADLADKKNQHKKKTRDQVLYLGRYYPVKIVTGNSSRITFKDESLILQHPDPEIVDLETSKELWLNHQARIYLRKKFYEIYELFKAYPLPPVMLQIRKKKRSWGTCYPNKKQIILNRELIKAPQECIEMVIVHELTHLIHPNHSKAFYAQFTKFMPNWKARHELLRKTMKLEMEL